MGILCDQVAARIQTYYWKCRLLVDNGLFVWLFFSRLGRSNGDCLIHKVTASHSGDHLRPRPSGGLREGPGEQRHMS